MLESLGSDLRFGARTLWKSRAFSAIAIITLALGVGASTAIFSVIDNILLEPFPYPAAQRLMSLEIHNTDESRPGGRGAYIPTPNFWIIPRRITCSTALLRWPRRTCCTPPVTGPNAFKANSSLPTLSNSWAFRLYWDAQRSQQITNPGHHLFLFCATKPG